MSNNNKFNLPEKTITVITGVGVTTFIKEKIRRLRAIAGSNGGFNVDFDLVAIADLLEDVVVGLEKYDNKEGK